MCHAYRIYASPFETIQRPKVTNEIEKNSKLRMTSSAKMTHLIFHIKKSILFHKIKFKLLLSGSRYFRKLLKSDRAYLYGGRDTRVPTVKLISLLKTNVYMRYLASCTWVTRPTRVTQFARHGNPCSRDTRFLPI